MGYPEAAELGQELYERARECYAWFPRKKQIAGHWSDQGEIKFSSEDVNCHGCKSDVISGYCRKLCKVRPCAVEKKVVTCAHCVDYLCDKLKEYLVGDPVAARNLERIRETLEVSATHSQR